MSKLLNDWASMCHSEKNGVELAKYIGDRLGSKVTASRISEYRGGKRPIPKSLQTLITFEFYPAFFKKELNLSDAETQVIADRLLVDDSEGYLVP